MVAVAVAVILLVLVGQLLGVLEAGVLAVKMVLELLRELQTQAVVAVATEIPLTQVWRGVLALS
jgi:hypothetical protein